MRSRACVGYVLGLLLAGGGVLTPALKAHPLAEIRFDRTIAVRLSASGIDVTYTLDVSVLGMHLDAARRLTPQEIARMERTWRGYATAYAHKAAEEVQSQLQVLVDGRLLKLELIQWEVTLTDHPSCRYLLRVRWPEGARQRLVEIQDRTFEDYPGVVHLTVAIRGDERDIAILDLEEPPLRLRSRPIEQLSAEEALQARRARVEVLLPAERMTSPPEVVPPSPGTLPRSDSLPDIPSGNWWTDLRERGLLALFDSQLGWGVLLLLAFLFGAAHAFTPGHGKTLVAAYLIGERGTIRHACLLALTTTLAHTGSVFLAAIILYLVYGTQIPALAHGLLQLVAGVLVVGVGIWLLSRRLAGQADHFHLFGNHHHHHFPSHSHSHSHAPSHRRPQQQRSGCGVEPGVSPSSRMEEGNTIGWLRLVLMGLGGGLVPCWDAVLLLVAASALGRLDAAIPLLLAFSFGLGTVLVALGVAVVYTLRAGQHHFSESRWFRMLPTFSAALLVGLGLWLCQNALAMLGGRAG